MCQSGVHQLGLPGETAASTDQGVQTLRVNLAVIAIQKNGLLCKASRSVSDRMRADPGLEPCKSATVHTLATMSGLSRRNSIRFVMVMREGHRGSKGSFKTHHHILVLQGPRGILWRPRLWLPVNASAYCIQLETKEPEPGAVLELCWSCVGWSTQELAGPVPREQVMQELTDSACRNSSFEDWLYRPCSKTGSFLQNECFRISSVVVSKKMQKVYFCPDACLWYMHTSHEWFYCVDWPYDKTWIAMDRHGHAQAMSIGTELEHFMEYVFGFCAALDEALGIYVNLHSIKVIKGSQFVTIECC